MAGRVGQGRAGQGRAGQLQPRASWWEAEEVYSDYQHLRMQKTKTPL